MNPIQERIRFKNMGGREPIGLSLLIGLGGALIIIAIIVLVFAGFSH